MKLSKKIKNLEKNSGGKVLMVAYYYPPLSGSGVFRSIRFIKYISAFNWKPTVISTDEPPVSWNYSDPSQMTEIPKGLDILRIHNRSQEEYKKGFTVQRLNEVLNFMFKIVARDGFAAYLFKNLVKTNKGISDLINTDCGLSWAFDTFSYIEKQHINMKQFDAIYTTSGPWASHFLGYCLSQKYNIPWVADWRDPWNYNPAGIGPNFNDPFSQLKFLMEKALLHQASVNVIVGEMDIPMYLNNFDLPTEKVACITNGYDEENFAKFPEVLPKNEKFTINYSGLLYTKERNILPILAAVKSLIDKNLINKSEIQFRLIGKSVYDDLNTARQFDLESIMVQTGYIAHEKALTGSVTADLLILLIGDEEKQKRVYTGKVFEYLRAGRPILALAPKDGVVDKALKESGHGKAFLSTQTDEIAQMILDEYNKWKAGKNSHRMYSPAIKKFEGKFLTGKLAKILDSVKKPQ